MEPFDIIHIDTKSGFGGLGTKKVNLHLAIDAFSRFVWGVVSVSKVGANLINLINKMMVVKKPKLVVADNYPAIKGNLFQRYLRQNDIAMVFISPEHSSSNGMIERFNQTIVNRLCCERIEQSNIAWSTQVKQCLNEYNNSIHSSTKYTPIYLLIGADKEDFFQGESLEDSRVIALENSMLKHQQNADKVNKNRKDPKIEIGDNVLVQTINQLNKCILDPNFEDPYEVKNELGNCTYEIEKNGNMEKYYVSQVKNVGMAKYLGNRSYSLTSFMLLSCH